MQHTAELLHIILHHNIYNFFCGMFFFLCSNQALDNVKLDKNAVVGTPPILSHYFLVKGVA